MLLKDGGFIKKHFNKFFVVNIVAWFITIAGEMIASLVAGIFIDADAVTAVELIEPIYCFVFFFGIIISTGAAIIYSKAMGAYDFERAKKIAGMSALVSIGIGILLSLSLFLLKNTILDFYNCSGRLLEYTSKYYDTFIWHSLIYPFYWSIYYLVNYDGDEKSMLFSDLALAVVDLVACLLLVKPLGITGIGLGNVLAVVAGMLILIPHFFKKSNTIKFKFYFNFKDLIEMIKISASNAMSYLYMAIVDVVFNKSLIYLFGSSYIPAYTVVNTIINFTNILSSGIASGSLFISINYGEDNPYAIKRVMKMVCKYTLIFSLCFMAVLLFVAPYWANIFSIEVKEVIELATFTGYVLPLSYVAAGFVYTFVNYYPVVDESFAGNALSFTYMFLGPLVIALPLCYLLGFKAMIVGFAFIPVFSLLLHILYLKLKKSLKNILLLKPSLEKELHYDLHLNELNVKELLRRLTSDLKNKQIKESVIWEINDIIENLFKITKEKNKKKVTAESSILFDDHKLRMIIRDDGEIVNLFSDSEPNKRLSCESQYDVTTSFNRNTFTFKTIS